MRKSVAIAYSPEAYTVQGYQIAGRLTAGEGFLRAYIEFGNFDTILCHTPSVAHFKKFCEQIAGWNIRPLQFEQIHPMNGAALSAAGTLYRPDPIISRFGWQRLDGGSHSLCGVTYTLAERLITEQLFETTVAPLFPWDAIVCASQSGKRVIQNLFQEATEYLAWKFKTPTGPEIKLPIIPLGVDTRKFPSGKEREKIRAEQRESLGLQPHEIALLFVGRLTPFTKANPVPMFQGMQHCSQKTTKKLTALLAGWFESEQEEQAFRSAATTFAPNVRIVFIQRPSAEELSRIYVASDIFVSLSDNIQETFGLTVVEAMAAGLPVVVSDWDGYREIVQHGSEGFTVPTFLAQAGSAQDLAEAYHRNVINYPTFAGHISLLAGIQMSAYVTALLQLIDSEPLRLSMANAGRAKAQTIFDWSKIITQYEALWSELAAVRRSASSQTYRVRTSPRCPDPTEVFSHYATKPLSTETLVSLADGANSFEALSASLASGFGIEARLPAVRIMDWLGTLADGRSARIETLLGPANSSEYQAACRTIAYLLKFNVLKIPPE
jgi:starch synthase